MPWSIRDIPSQEDRVAVVTGANGGLGLETARALAGTGAHVVMAARNQDKAAAARADILGSHPGASLEIVPLDLGSLASVADAARAITTAHDRVDLLVLNAGVMATPEGTTADGFETQLGTNVLGHWALLSHLLPTVVRTPGARVVTLSSVAQHQGKPLDPANPHLHGSYGAWTAYGQSKLAMRHLAQGLQRQLTAAGLDARAVVAHPGLTNSELQATTVTAGGGGFMGRASHAVAAVVGMSASYGALSQLRAATDPAAPAGGMYGPLLGVTGPPVRKPLVRPGATAAIAALWQVGERETGLPVDVRSALAEQV